MNPEMKRAATEAAARVVSPVRLYRPCETKSTTINEILARLLFSLESPHRTATERSNVLGVVDRLIRLKIDNGLLVGVPHDAD
jgi:hypothetical protein